MRKPRIDWLDPDILQQVTNKAAQGMTDGQIALSFGVSRDTITRNKKNNHAFQAALKNGESKGIDDVTNALFTNAIKGNLGAQIFYLKNKAGWTDKQEVSVDADSIVLNLNYVHAN